MTRPNGEVSAHLSEAVWRHNSQSDSYWLAALGPFQDGDTVHYCVHGRSTGGEVAGPASSFRVGPKIHLALLWHHHQPLYLDSVAKDERYLFPWVRLHSIRDYYAMAALAARYPQVHMTINLVPSLLFQIEGYLDRKATDVALELTRKPASVLTAAEREDILGSFFDADWHNQIHPHPRYKELFDRRLAGAPFSAQDITDLQMWFNLAWFAPELLEAEIKLPDGTRINLAPLVHKGRGFTQADLDLMIEAQYAVMRGIVPLHRALQDAGQIEVSTTPFYHPILPLIHDTDLAAAGEPGMIRPSRFQAPEDARAQVEKAVEFYEKRFGMRPKGMWPAEGAVGQSVVDHFVESGIRWVASDQGVLARSGRWGYRADEPDVLCRPYRAEGRDGSVSVFFRDRELSDAIGFRYRSFADQTAAARSFISEIKERLAVRVTDHANRVVTVALDGDNAWGAYPQAARPFLNALYRALSDDPEIKTVTFSEYLDGGVSRAVAAHPPESQPKVHDLFHGSWIDTWGSSPGVDLGTWIGEPEENQAWEMLRAARESLRTDGASPQSHPQAFEALYAAEGSDWFWWFGSDHDSGYDDVFDQLYRGHLRTVYLASGRQPPVALATSLRPRAVTWTFARPVSSIQLGDRLVIRTNCAGVVRWSVDSRRTHHETPMARAGGVMAGLHSYSALLGPFQRDVTRVEFVFQCAECRCEDDKSCCAARRHAVEVIGP